MKQENKIYFISTPRQLEVLSSPVRNEMIEVMMRLGSSTIGEIAEAMGRSAESLYYHMEQLRRVSAVRLVERRKGKRQLERVYELVANDFRINETAHSPAFRRALKKAARALLQQSATEMEASIDSGQANKGDSAQTHRIGRDIVCLSDEALAELNERIVELHEWLGELDDDDAAHRIALTLAMCKLS